MSDLQIMREMFKRRHIEFVIGGAGTRYPAPKVGTNLIVEGGYSGFFTVFTFTETEALNSVEAYE